MSISEPASKAGSSERVSRQKRRSAEQLNGQQLKKAWLKAPAKSSKSKGGVDQNGIKRKAASDVARSTKEGMFFIVDPWKGTDGTILSGKRRIHVDNPLTTSTSNCVMSPTRETTPLTIELPPGVPTWAAESVTLFKCEDTPSEFQKLIILWIKFETAEDWVPAGKFSATHRPQAVYDWIS